MIPLACYFLYTAVAANGFDQQRFLRAGPVAAGDAVQLAAGGGSESGSAGQVRLASVAAGHTAIKGGRERPHAREVQGQEDDQRYRKDLSRHVSFCVLFFPANYNHFRIGSQSIL